MISIINSKYPPIFFFCNEYLLFICITVRLMSIYDLFVLCYLWCCHLCYFRQNLGACGIFCCTCSVWLSGHMMNTFCSNIYVPPLNLIKLITRNIYIIGVSISEDRHTNIVVPILTYFCVIFTNRKNIFFYYPIFILWKL